ncbi:DNA phosphorothioation system sulfurtransferase DndC [Paenibacillus sp. FSL W7-1287]|uniref:DNA phosphorothioation system sulfurtransferase DndC n=1 Tax=Paenibacillus sp. FSL W7-1287 TaxID=2954538 RepID=UPI0030F91E77
MLKDLLQSKSKYQTKIDELKEVYLSDDRPWVIGYSGGKDSTVVVQLVFEMLQQLELEQRKKQVYIISSDTMVETPLIISSINHTLYSIQTKGIELKLPIETHKVKPEVQNTFWSLLIGKGYPSPRQKFRWCTDRMKIDPANRFILDKVSKFGEVIMVLGVREEESATRAQSIKQHTIEGSKLMKHSSLKNAFVYAPIREFALDDVWNYLLVNQAKTPWGTDNYELYALYQNSSAGECPLIVDKEIKETAGSCGNSRFGCWVCTVVKEDKALVGFIDSGESWMTPLLEFRNWLASIRDDRNLREKSRMNGSIYYVGEGDDRRLGLGPYTLEARQLILKKLLETEKQVENPYEPDYKLIQIDELKQIRKLWIESGDWEDSLPQIYFDVYGEMLDWDQEERAPFDSSQITDLELICQENDVDFQLIKKLINIEKNYVGYKIRRGLIEEFQKVLNQDIVHHGKVEGYKE